jgi:transcriptional regulator with XRE-family HTH domain
MNRRTTIAADLRRAIKAAGRRGLTRYRIAKITGLSQGQLSRFVAGEIVPKLDTAEKIAAALGKRLTLVDS